MDTEKTFKNCTRVGAVHPEATALGFLQPSIFALGTFARTNNGPCGGDGIALMRKFANTTGTALAFASLARGASANLECTPLHGCTRAALAFLLLALVCGLAVVVSTLIKVANTKSFFLQKLINNDYYNYRGQKIMCSVTSYKKHCKRQDLHTPA